MFFTVIIHAANDAVAFIEKAKIFARRHFAEKAPRIIIRNAEAYDPKQHETADAVITQPQYETLIAHYEKRDAQVIVADEATLDAVLNPAPPQAPAEVPDPTPEPSAPAEALPSPAPAESTEDPAPKPKRSK